MASTAYLLVCCDLTQNPPTVVAADIFSEDGMDLMTPADGKHQWAEIMHEDGKTYQEAKDHLIRHLYNPIYWNSLQWVIDLWEKTGRHQGNPRKTYGLPSV